jgi:hypothetical protein
MVADSTAGKKRQFFSRIEYGCLPRFGQVPLRSVPRENSVSGYPGLLETSKMCGTTSGHHTISRVKIS